MRANNNNINAEQFLGTMLKEFLTKKRDSILGKWFDLILKSYHPDVSKFLKKERDRFNNPVGHNIFQNINRIYDDLLNDTDGERIAVCLDNIIRIRSVQDFSAREAVAFIFQLKKIIREELGSENRGDKILKEILEFEREIDELALLAFQIYMRCREELFEIRAKELRNRSDKLLEMADITGCGSGKKEDSRMINGVGDAPKGDDPE